MRTRHSLAIVLLAGASIVALAGVASAQSQQAAAAEPEQVIVTGSRIISNGNDMPTPVTIVSPDELLQSVPKSIMDGLADLPIFDGGRSPQTNVGNSSQNNASHQFNIRNVGITRTLILYDGRRIAPTSPTGEIDADIIPQMLLQRVDVVTGGVSAVYGSDAVAGVVNFITDKSFNGVKADVMSASPNMATISSSVSALPPAPTCSAGAAISRAAWNSTTIPASPAPTSCSVPGTS